MKKIFAVGLTLLSLHANANVNVFNVQNEIKKQNANWMAKSTSVSGLSDFEVKRMLGSKDMPNGDELFYDRSKGNESLDWRNVSGLNWLGPVMNQGNCGSCVAFASIATLEARYRIASGQIWANPTFSPQHLFSCGGGACNFGWFASEAADSLKEDGVLDNACAPYSAGSTGVDVACKDIQCPDQNRRLYKIANFSTPSNYGGNAESVKAALKYGPLLTTMVVYDDFLTYAGGIYKHVTGKKAGGHAISLVGFNDLERYWVIRNSWGDDWGEGGFARVSYDDISGIAGSTWAFDINSDKSYFSIVTPSEHSYISGKADINVEMRVPTAATIHLNGSNESTTLNECAMSANNICTQSIDTETLKDGRYEVFAESNGKRSQVKEFLVLNHKPETTLSFARADGKPMSTPFTGRLELDIDVKASPVVPQTLKLVITDLNGKVVAERATDTVLEKMRLGFRFNTIPNGTYKVSFIVKTPYRGQMVTATSNVETITTQN